MPERTVRVAVKVGTVPITHGDGTVYLVRAERIGRGLALTKIEGGWTVTHLRSGNVIRQPGDEPQATAKRLASKWLTALLASGIDWTRPGAELYRDKAIIATIAGLYGKPDARLVGVREKVRSVRQAEARIARALVTADAPLPALPAVEPAGEAR